MTLTLEVVSSNGQSLGAARRKVFGPEGGRIGRALECEWVVENPYISRHHATVRCVDGAYYIESTGENRVAVNSPQTSIPAFKPWELQNGDRLYLDEYEIAVTLDNAHFAPMPQARPSPGIGQPQSPFEDLEPTRNAPALAAPFDLSDEEVDPIRRLSGRSSGPAPDPQPEAKPSWNHTPGINDHYAPPPVPPASNYEALIPEDWNKTSFGRTKVESGPPPTAGERSSAPLSQEIPENWAETGFGMGKRNAQEPSLSPAARASPSSPPGPSPRHGTEGPRSGAQPLPERAVRPSVPMQSRATSGPPPQPPSPRPPPAQVPQPAAAANRGAAQAAPRVAPRPASRAPLPGPSETRPSSFDVDAFLRAAGLDPSVVSPDTAASMGQILRTVIQGVVEVLHARAQVKDQFRLAATRVMTNENNPLKFSVNAESALSFLLGHRDPAYLAPIEAFEDAMNDIRFHQLAMLSGMRAGFDHMMKHFDPSQLQQLFDKRAKRGGLLAMGAKSRYWEQYTEEFDELAGDPEAAFRRVFGEAFASGYEKQLNTLKASHGKLQR